MYGLRYEYFTINPKKEFQVFFAREEEFARFYRDLVGMLDSRRVPRYVVFGLFGVGKTHFLLHLGHEIADRADAVYVETPSSHRRTSFVEFYRSIISALGRNTILSLLEEGMRNPEAAKEFGLSEDLAYVINNAVKEKKFYILWKFLSGEKLKPAEAEALQAVRPGLSAEEAVTLLNTVAIIHERTKGKPLLLLVDEFENTMNIGGDARTAFTEAMRSLVDEGSRVGVVFALTSRALAEMPSAIYDEPVRRRIGITNYIPFQEYKEDELEKFMHQTISYRRESEFDIKGALANLKTSETIEFDTYPFSREALREIVNSVVLFREQGKVEALRPKEALEMMDKGLRVAIATKLPFIGRETILAVREEVVEALRL